jgi:hypothetical protein
MKYFVPDILIKDIDPALLMSVRQAVKMYFPAIQISIQNDTSIYVDGNIDRKKHFLSFFEPFTIKLIDNFIDSLKSTLDRVNNKKTYLVAVVKEYDPIHDVFIGEDITYIYNSKPDVTLTFSPPVSKAVNDYTCPTCKNDKCSRNEKTCWRCGNKL